MYLTLRAATVSDSPKIEALHRCFEGYIYVRSISEISALIEERCFFVIEDSQGDIRATGGITQIAPRYYCHTGYVDTLRLQGEERPHRLIGDISTLSLLEEEGERTSHVIFSLADASNRFLPMILKNMYATGFERFEPDAVIKTYYELHDPDSKNLFFRLPPSAIAQMKERAERRGTCLSVYSKADSFRYQLQIHHKNEVYLT